MALRDRKVFGAFEKRAPRAGLFESWLTLTQAMIEINRSINFYAKKILFTANVLFSLRLFKLKTKGQTI